MNLKEERLDRYSRQIRFSGIQESGQEKLLSSRALVCGCGALGSVVANTLVRAGVGSVRIIDRDYLELNNLQRQVLYDEEDVVSGLPKAVAAAKRLRKINSAVEIEPIVADVNFTNIGSYCRDVDVIVDGTDNFEIRFLLNDAAISFGIPWVYGGCIGADGQTMTILPGKTPCLACLMSDGPPPPGTTATCDSAGILAPIINIIASIQANEAIKILSGNSDKISRKLQVFDIWDNRSRQMDLDSLWEKEQPCPVCKEGEYQWLSGTKGSQSAILCGRNSVQLSFPGEKIDLESLAKELTAVGKVESNPFLIRFFVDDFQVTVFPDARAIISGTEDLAIARSVYSRYIGN